MNIDLNKNTIYLFEKIFLYVFLIYSILSSNSFTYGKGIITYFMWASFGLGTVLLIYRLINIKNYKKPGIIFLLLMFISICISTIINYRYSFKGNVIFCIYWALFFFVIYLMNSNKDIILAFLKVFTVYVVVSSTISVILMYKGYSYIVVAPDTGYLFYQGFAIGRLWGVFINPNNGAISAALSIVIMLYFVLENKNSLVKVLGVLGIINEIIYIAFTDSRSGAVCLGVLIATYSFVVLWDKKKNIVKKSFIIVLSVIMLMVGFYLPRKTKDIYNASLTKISEYKASKEVAPETPVLDNNVNDMDSISDDVEELVIDRGYDLSDDISNRRFDAWKSAIEIYASSLKNIVFGVSFKGFTEYALENLPSTYIVNNNYALFTTFDNEIFNILDAQGAIGIVSLFAIMAFVLFYISKHIWKTNDIKLVALLVSVIFGMAASACFCSIMFYHFSPNGLLFWLVLGGLVSVFNEEEKEWGLML